MRALTILALLMITVAASMAQTHVVFGELTAYNKYPVANIEVTAKKSKATAVTDSLGQFTIVCNEKDMLKIKPQTFKSLLRKVNRDTDTLRINLVFMDSQKNRDLAVGYGYMDREDLTFAADHMEQENNEYCNYSNIYELLKGKFPGVQVDGTSGRYRVFIRGAQSVAGSNEVLFVVDGSSGASIDGLLPCNIRSIDVIKDGMASVYGVRGSNGVVLINTKR